MKKILRKIFEGRKPEFFWLSGALLVICLGWMPYILTYDKVPITYDDDWNWFFMMHEGARKSIMEYGQFPFWFPWHRGGVPLFAHPFASVLSLDTLFVICFGAVKGLRLAIMFNVLLGATGMWFLLKRSIKAYSICFWGTVLFGLQGTLAMHITAGHSCMIGIVWLPWLSLFALMSPKRLAAALALGLTAGIMMLQYFHYMTIINSLITICLMLYLWIKNYKNRIFYQNMIASVLAFATVASFRLLITIPLCLQFTNKPFAERVSIEPWLFLKALVWPMQWVCSMPNAWKDVLRWHELGCYIGIIAVVMFFSSLWKGWRWFHTCFVLTLLIALDSSLPFLPGYWINGPSIIRVPTRWRFAVIFFLIIGATAGMQMIAAEVKNRRKRNWLLGTLISVSIAGLIFSQYYNWSHRKMVSIAKAENLLKTKCKTIVTADYGNGFLYPATFRNIGLKNSFDPLFNTNKTTKVKAFNEPGYRGEISFFPPDATVERWSPDEIVFVTSSPTVIAINQNPGSYWRLDGAMLYPDAKAIEYTRDFIFKVPEKGRYSLRTRPPLFEAGLICTGISFACLAGYLLFLRERQRKKHEVMQA